MIQPNWDLVKIDVEALPEQTSGGIILPQDAQKLLDEGQIVAIGPDVARHAVGQRVVFARYAGSWVKDGGKDYLLIEERDLRAVVS